MTITTEHLTHFEFRHTFPLLEYRDAFYLFDQDENGYITSKELHDIMRTLGFNVNEQELQQIILNVDYDSKYSGNNSSGGSGRRVEINLKVTVRLSQNPFFQLKLFKLGGP